MKKTIINRLVILIAVTSLILTVFSGCSNSKTSTVNKNSTKNEAKSKIKNETVNITDMAGRTIEIPSKIEKVYSTSPAGTIFLYTLAPEKLIGWNYPLSKQEKKYINKDYYDLPVLGGWFGKKNTGNIEEILKANPDIIINMGSISNTDIDSANKIQEQTGIPVIMVSGEDLLSYDKSYEFVGNLFGTETKAKELAEYAKKTIDEVKAKVENIPLDKRVRVYYAEGPNGLQTDPESSYRTEVLKLAGGKNVADVNMNNGYGRTEVSLEQLLLWNPDIIITEKISNSDELSFYQTVFTNDEWKDIAAVKNGKVFGIPQCPFSWFDRPASVNRIVGVKWLANLLYPDIFNYDIKNEVKIFYDKFYHYDLTDDEVNEILEISSSDTEQTLMVYSGAGLRKAMDEVGEKFKDKYGIQVQFNYANCSQVMSQLELSNDGDVFVAGSGHYYDLANEKGLVEEKVDIAYHIPAIAVAKGNEKNIKDIEDLKKDGIKVILGDTKATAIGRISKKMLEKDKIFDDVMKNVEATTATVNELIVHMSMNDADAAIVWEDNLYNLENIQTVSIPKEKNIIKTVPVTILKNSSKKELAQKFVDFISSEEGKECFKNHGFKTIE